MATKKKKASKRKPAKKKTSKRKATTKKAKPKRKATVRPKRADGKPIVGGRASLLTPEVQAQICDYLSYGNYIETAAAAVGIDQSTLRRWLKRGRREMQRLETTPHNDPDPNELIYLDFCKAVDIAEAQAEVDGLRMIKAHSFEDWKALAWRLERKSFSRWGRRQALEHSGPDGKPVTVQRLKIGGKIIEF